MGKVIGKRQKIYKLMLSVVIILLSASLFYTSAQYYKSELKAPAPGDSKAPMEVVTNDKKKAKEGTQFPTKQAAPQSYEELLNPQETPIDLKQPKNIESHAEYDPLTRTYVIRTKVGDREIVTPFILSENNIMIGKFVNQCTSIIVNVMLRH